MHAALWLPLLLAAAPALNPSLPAGRQAYETYCATCHGADVRGSVNGPSIRGVGAAAIDFWLVTGRMPAAVPWIQVDHRGAQLRPETIAAIEAYVVSIDPSGPPIPAVAAGGDLAHGRVLYEQNCEHCHGVDAGGASIGGSDWAPSLHDTSITQVAEAMRIGPGQMPRFDEAQLDARALDDVATYVFALDRRARTHQLPLGSSGPVPEGLFGWLAVGALSVLAFAFSRGAR